ncbi:sensor histidine kinase [Neptunicella sp. SCSIO 80796]|uniref:sensor histidine kinase n=1 Tax=Neptunicella plasticusilytica TaxID=3117012 RepID=UPI003A4D8896
MKKSRRIPYSSLPFQIEDLVAVITILLVAAVALQQVKQSSTAVVTVLLIAGFMVYLASFLYATRGPGRWVWRPAQIVALILMVAVIFGLVSLVPLLFLTILLIIWVSVLPFYMSVLKSLGVMLVAITVFFSFYVWRWQTGPLWITALLYGTFHLFAILMTFQARRAMENAEQTQRLNQQLLATQHLLTQAGKQSERTRIARDLHDLVGHHLTALIIKLQVSSHHCEGEARQQVDECHKLAKLLLSDVRDAVSTLRESRQLDFATGLELLLEHVPRLRFHLDIDADIELEDIELANSILFCIQEALTNCLKHTNATRFNLAMSRNADHYQLMVSDNGHAIHQDKITFGNGLKGMQERLNAFSAKLNIAIIDHCLHLDIRIPLSSGVLSV